MLACTLLIDYSLMRTTYHLYPHTSRPLIGPAPSGPSGSGPGRSLIVDSKELRTKKTETDERSFCYREQLVCL